MGGSNDDNNIAILTLEEHFICHQLLVKMHPNNKKLIYALNMMCKGSRRKSNKRYGWIKRKLIAPKIVKHCKFCNCQFLSRESTKKELCSFACRDKYIKAKRLKIICECCKKEFTTPLSRKHRRFCSEDCRINVATKTSIIMQCGFCSKDMRVIDSQRKCGKKFCSVVCSGLARQKQKTYICEVCKNSFINLTKSAAANKFCSRACYNSTRRTTKPCKGCNKEFTSERNLNRLFCSRQCYILHK